MRAHVIVRRFVLAVVFCGGAGAPLLRLTRGDASGRGIDDGR